MYKSLTEAKAALFNGDCSSFELVSHHLNVIKNLDPKLNAMIDTYEDHALEQAKICDKAMSQQSPQSLPPLHGLPIIHKDIFCTTVDKTTCGSKMLQNFRPNYDATVVARLKNSGMIQLGTSNMDEFAMGSSNENSYFGPCFNPWDTTRVPGGSSGGSAAAVAAGYSPVATGTDTGGSIRQPAAFCGITGLKPSYGSLSRYGMIAFASTLDQAGFFAKDVRDIALLLEHSVGIDPNDSTTIHTPETNYSQACQASEDNLTIGIPSFLDTSTLPKDIEKAYDNTKKTLAELGFKFKTVDLPHSQYAMAAYYIIAPAECSSNLARFDGIKYGYRHESTSNLEELYIKSRTEGFGEEVKRRILLGTFALSSGYFDAYYEQAAKVRNLIKQDFIHAFSGVDLILLPTTPSCAFKLNEKSKDPVSMYHSDLFTLPASLAGLPAISFPAGNSNGLPIGMQLVSNHLQEKTLIQSVYQYQQQTHWHTAEPSLTKG